jgi:hypothetical protein
VAAAGQARRADAAADDRAGQAGKSDLLRNVDWVSNDFSATRRSASSSATTGRAPCAAPAATTTTSRAPRRSTPTCCPRAAAVKVVQLGCGDGAFAKAYKQINAVCNYTGIERDAIVAEQARAHCDFVYNQDFETPTSSATASWRRQLLGAGRRAGTLRDPWAVLAKIRSSMAADGTLVLSVRNIQHWSAQVRLNMGDFRYREDGVMHKDELRQFTRGSLLELAQPASA